MKTVLAFLLALVASSSYAAAVPLTPGPGIAGTASGFTTASSFTGQFSAASFNSNFTANVGGKAVTMPATMRMAANAGQFAVSAVRLNPAALVAGAVASWLLGQGIAYVEGQFMKDPAPLAGTNGYCYSSPYGTAFGVTTGKVCSIGEAERVYEAAWPHLMPHGAGYFTSYSIKVCRSGDPSFCMEFGQASPAPAPGKVPATQADFAPLEQAPLPDAAASELASKGVPLPLEVPHIAPQDIPLSDPYVDPVTGKRYRDQARITPISDGKTADVQTYKQEVDEAGNPKKQEDGQTDKPPEEQTDFCKKNPDASACKPFDEAPDSELQKKDNPFSLNPVSGFGADNASCPAPQNLFTAGGQQITWDWGKFCTFAQGIRPLIIGFAWLTAIMIVVSVGRRNG